MAKKTPNEEQAATAAVTRTRKPRYPKTRPPEERRLRRLIRSMEKELAEAKNEASAYKAKLDKAHTDNHELLVKQAKAHSVHEAKLNETWQINFEARTKEYKDALVHPWRLESQIKDFALVLNVVYKIGVRMVDEWVIFRKGEYDLRVSLHRILLHGLAVVPQMLGHLPATSDDPQNYIDGLEGWVHPEIEKNETEARRLAWRIARRYRLNLD